MEERVPKFQDGGKFMHRHDGLEWRERGSSGNQCAVMQGHREAFGIKVSLSTTTRDEKKRWLQSNLDSFKVVIIKIAKILDIAPSAAA